MKNNDIKIVENLNRKKGEYLIRWQMTKLCNYYCDFCIQGTKEQHIKKARGESLKLRNAICDGILQFIEEELNDNYKLITLALIGGEVTILPEFITILEKFVNCNFNGKMEIHITTNLSTDIVVLKKMKKLVKNKENRIIYISASYYKEFTNEKDFIKKARIFIKGKYIYKILHKKSNIKFTIDIPLTEDNDYDYFLYFKEKYKRIVDSINYVVIRKYKKSITDDLKSKLNKDNKKKIKVTLKNGSIRYYSKTNKISLDIEDSEFFNPSGFLCDVGINNISFDNLGNISRCQNCQKATLVGNILDNNFKMIKEKFKCPSNNCNCDCYGFIENK